jgi:hypothetical protein
MSNDEIRKQLEKQLQLLSKLSEKDSLSVDESVAIASMINTLASNLLLFS